MSGNSKRGKNDSKLSEHLVAVSHRWSYAPVLIEILEKLDSKAKDEQGSVSGSAVVEHIETQEFVECLRIAEKLLLRKEYWSLLIVGSLRWSLDCDKMTSKLPRTSMSLKQFMVHQEVIKLYRSIMKTIRKIPDKQDREFMKNWAKSDFRANKDVTDEFAIKSLIVHGENSLRELKKNLNLTK